MFESLSSSFQKVFRNLRGYGALSESNIRDALRDVRLALLEADVHFTVVKQFIDKVREGVLGKEVLGSVSPGQQFIKFVHDELVAILGGNQAELYMGGNPATIMLCGLHGSGKTTTAGKLARWLKKRGRSVLLVAGDLRRPAAVEQLAVLAEQAGVAVLKPIPGESLPSLGRRALEDAKRAGHDMVLFDTGGRFQIDEELVAELKEMKAAVKPGNVILVVDAAIGQESVSVAGTFHRELGLTGLVLTKLDGDARGGAALSIRSVTGCPVLFTGTGEHQDQLDAFYPDRMASRILGMGDVVSLVEKVQEHVDLKAMAETEKKIRTQDFNLEDFLSQFRQMKKMGPLEKILEMLPGGAALAADKGNAEEMNRFSKKAEAIIQSMTVRERRHPEVLNGSRRLRIAKGSGTTPQDVNDLLRQFKQAKVMAKKFGMMQKKLQRRR
ncbi:MAG: signal recognition particle protein [Kiritimatiellia bacterium]